MDHFRECFDRQVAATDELLRNFLNGPAPKEEEMDICIKCQGKFPSNKLVDGLVCLECVLQSPLINDNPEYSITINSETSHVAEHRAIGERAYFAAMTGYCAKSNADSKPFLADDIVRCAAEVALETVRRWDAFMAAVDAEGGE